MTAGAMLPDWNMDMEQKCNEMDIKYKLKQELFTVKFLPQKNLHIRQFFVPAFSSGKEAYDV